MDCIGNLMEKFGLDENQATDLMTEVKRERAAVERKFGGQGLINVRTAELYKRLEANTDRAALEAAAHKRALTLQYARRLEAFDMITQQFKGMEEEGLSALLVGTNRVREGARLSVDAMQTSLRGYYLGGLIADVQSLGKVHLEMLKKGVLDREIARALWRGVGVFPLILPSAHGSSGPAQLFLRIFSLPGYGRQHRQQGHRPLFSGQGSWLRRLLPLPRRPCPARQ